MPTEMRNLSIDKVDLVDKGAQGDFVTVRLYKRDADENDQTRTNQKSRTQRAQRSTEEDPMPTSLSDEQIAALPDEVAKAFRTLQDELEAAQKAASTEEEIPLSKRDDLPEDVRKRFEEQEERIAKAEQVAATERETRLRKDWREKVDGLTNLPPISVAKGEDDESTLADRLYEIAETDEDLANGIHKMLSTLDTQVGQSELFSEVGKRGAGENSPEGRLEQVVKGLVADGMSEPEAWEKAITEHSDDYNAYVAEKGA